MSRRSLSLQFPLLLLLLLLPPPILLADPGVLSPGKKQLPDVQLLAQRLLLRNKFIPAPQGTNIFFAFFAQHFTHQFFKTSGKMGPSFTKALGHGIDLGHIYGDNLERQYHLRLFKDGKLKYQMNSACW
ncbi:Prostaglandin G/H synthase 1 [Lemmus lemmus]